MTFRKPNKPGQPTKGVYRWSYKARNGNEITFYVGEAGKRKCGPSRQPSTLARGASHLVRPSLSVDKDRRKLDTDFIVGTAIKFLTEKGYDCVWEHICNDPHEEKGFCCAAPKPILQDGMRIHKEFKLERYEGAPWDNKNPNHVKQAERLLHREFRRAFGL